MIYKGNSFKYYRPKGEQEMVLLKMPIRVILSEVESWEQNELNIDKEDREKALKVSTMGGSSYNIDEKLEVFDKIMEDFLSKEL